MKKMFPLLLLLLIVILPINVKALSVNENDLTIEKGDSKNVELYAEVDTEVKEIAFTLVYTTYDIPAYFNLESGLTDTNPNGVAHKIVFPEPVSGKVKLGTINVQVVKNPKDLSGTINIHSGSAITTNDETINLNAQTINITIGEEEHPQVEEPTTENEPEAEEPKQEDKKENDKKEENKKENKAETTNLLEKIESNIVKINLKENVYEYTVKVKEEIEELDLKPIVKDEKYKVEITTQKISELKDNKIIITVKDGDNKQKYIINVEKITKTEIEIDEEEFEPSYKYKSKWITLIAIMLVVLVAGLGLSKKK